MEKITHYRFSDIVEIIKEKFGVSFYCARQRVYLSVKRGELKPVGYIPFGKGSTGIYKQSHVIKYLLHMNERYE